MQGYKGIIAEKKNGKSACAVFYKKDKFETIEEQVVTCEMSKGEDLEMPLVHLKDKAS